MTHSNTHSDMILRSDFLRSEFVYLANPCAKQEWSPQT
ncbi:hypothetical protein VH12019_00197 [Vibrio phage VH1_2019]|uniref:Uncharacterized protein n=2 Tax=Schizotequatrovirus KVP40 TaxID=1914019 RepID=A0A6B9SW20_9CAUD|nr:hypothetical protein pp2_316 [Vibrio phage phi-pp2]QHJ74498.1 hypothetical protein VH12019_00197 [Vibrio phage VH1_2019]WOL24845.1 hypothetical protein [Vibrio phage PG216]